MKEEKNSKRQAKRRKPCSITDSGETPASEAEASDSSSEEETYVSENTCRRANWQKGRQDWSRPSKIATEVKKVTVDTYQKLILRKHGWAILRDVNTAFVFVHR